MRTLLLTPPMVQLNTPYPATPYLTGFLRSRGFTVSQVDPALGWVLRLLSRPGLTRVRASLAPTHHPAVEHFLRHAENIIAQVEVAVGFLQGREPSMAQRIASRRFLIEGPRFQSVGPAGHEDEYLAWAFGNLGVHDRAKYFATLFLEDIADAIREGVDQNFGFARYGEKLAASQPTLDPILEALSATPVTAQILDELTRELLAAHHPDIVGMTIPFPGNVLGGLRMAQSIRACAPHVRIVWGGGYVNTELRELSDFRFFTLVDALTYDDGERPLLLLIEHWQGKRPREELLRTRLRDAWCSAPGEQDVPLSDAGCPTYDGLPLQDYLSMLDMLNPMHRLWSDTRWNKLTVAHGCYWKKCTFCDLSLDYIRNYQPLATERLVDHIEALIAETGTRGFHFVDEAAPPAVLKALAQELLRRDVPISWWGNIRFEKAFTKELCALLSRSGCIAITGGLEVASNRLLELMQKGVTVEQVAQVTRAFADAGVLVHAYLMYGFPTQTEQETIDSLEMVRQLFVAGCLDSAYWHRFTATAHAPIGLSPESYGLKLLPTPSTTFARNDLAFTDPTGCDHDRLGVGLHKAVYNYMLGLELEEDVRSWFDAPVPKPTVPRRFIARALAPV